jgi:hypothetical protein
MSVSPSNLHSTSITDAAIVFKHTETEIYFILIIVVMKAFWVLLREVTSFERGRTTGQYLKGGTTVEDKPLSKLEATCRGVLICLSFRSFEYLTYYVLVYISVTLPIRYNVLYVTNLAVYTFFSFLIMYCMQMAYASYGKDKILPWFVGLGVSSNVFT